MPSHIPPSPASTSSCLHSSLTIPRGGDMPQESENHTKVTPPPPSAIVPSIGPSPDATQIPAIDVSTMDEKFGHDLPDNPSLGRHRLSEPEGTDCESLLRSIPSSRFPEPTTLDHNVSNSDETLDSDDVFENYNRHFPPLLPTVGRHLTISRNRKQLTEKIANTVTHTERITSKMARPRLAPRSSFTSSKSYSDEDNEDDNSYVSEDDDSQDASSEDEIQTMWMRLKDKRLAMTVKKAEMADRRKQLRELRRRNDEVDNRFMGLFRPVLSENRQGSPGIATWSHLDKHFAEMQEIRTAYHSMESSYEDLEVSLDEEEEALNELEVRFFSFLAMGHLRTRPPTKSARQSVESPEPKAPPMPYLLLGITGGDSQEDDHPYWKDLVSAVGDMNLAQEDLDDLRLRRDQVVFELEVQQTLDEETPFELEAYKNIGREALREYEDFMDNFPVEEDAKQRTHDWAVQEVQRLRRCCRYHGVEKKHMSYAIAYALDGNAAGEDMVLDDSFPPGNTLAHYRFPLLLSRPDHVLREPEPLTAVADLEQSIKLRDTDRIKQRRLEVAQKEYGIHQLVYNTVKAEKGEISPDMVTRWLLYQLRTSPLEAELLATTFSANTTLKIVDVRRWQHDVLFHWLRDGSVVNKYDDEDRLRDLTGTSAGAGATGGGGWTTTLLATGPSAKVTIEEQMSQIPGKSRPLGSLRLLHRRPRRLSRLSSTPSDSWPSSLVPRAASDDFVERRQSRWSSTERRYDQKSAVSESGLDLGLGLRNGAVTGAGSR